MNLALWHLSRIVVMPEIFCPVFTCPGIQSIYVSGDRRYKFKCCNDEGFDHTDCHQSHHLNKAGEDFEYKVDRDKRFYITGISSCFNSEKRYYSTLAQLS